MTEDDTDAPIEKSTSAERIRHIKASFQHLLDLKRQGYSPRYCELAVDSRDRILAQPMRRPTQGPKPLAMVGAMMQRRRQRL